MGVGVVDRGSGRLSVGFMRRLLDVMERGIERFLSKARIVHTFRSRSESRQSGQGQSV